MPRRVDSADALEPPAHAGVQPWAVSPGNHEQRSRRVRVAQQHSQARTGPPLALVAVALLEGGRSDYPITIDTHFFDLAKKVQPAAKGITLFRPHYDKKAISL
jgi:hypothetical protein